MSDFKEMMNSEINDNYYKKNSQLNKASLISYIEEDDKASLIEWMKRGYKEMAKLNLEICESGFASDFNDANEYESWLFGVWYM